MSKNKKPNFERDFIKAREKNANQGVIGRIKSMTTDKSTADKSTVDSYVNLTAKLGIQADNMSAASYYNLGPYITRNRLELEAGYRGNWLIGKVVDCVAEDMTRDGITMQSEAKPDDITELQVAISEFNIWHDICNAIKWARLYGGCLAVMLIDGADYSTPLNIESIGKNKFKGLVILDRWMVQPNMSDLITDICKDIGKPKFYEVLPGVSTFPAMQIHHSRVLRFEGIELPYYQKLFENFWGLSVIERMLDRLVAFDSATLGAAQLLYKAHLRVLSVGGFREALAMGGQQEDAIIKQFQYIRALQCNEGLTVIDSNDTFATYSYNFSGVSDALQQLGQQISGAEDIPLVRLFGQSPAGFNTGDADIRNYYDHILRRQENELRPNLERLLAVLSMSRLHKPLPEDFEFRFVPLWQLSEKEKSEIASTNSATINGAVQGNLISRQTGMKELLQQSRVTNIFTNITQQDIDEAEEIVPSAPAIEKEPIEKEIEAIGNEGQEPAASIKEEPTANKGEEEPNERLGGANPKIADRLTFKDIWGSFIGRKKEIKQTMDAALGIKDDVAIEIELNLDSYKKKS